MLSSSSLVGYRTAGFKCGHVAAILGTCTLPSEIDLWLPSIDDPEIDTRTVVFGNACWIHMLGLYARITQRDRERHQWNSAGNTKITRTRSGKISNVSGGPKLKSTQAYPWRFCDRVRNLHREWCFDLNLLPDIPDEHRLKEGPYQFVSWLMWYGVAGSCGLHLSNLGT
eukprot:s4821_g2.t1